MMPWKRIAFVLALLGPGPVFAGDALFIWQPLPLIEATTLGRLTIAVESHAALSNWITFGALADLEAADIELAVRVRAGLAVSPWASGVRGFSAGIYPGYLTVSPARAPSAFPVTARITYVEGAPGAPVVSVGAGVTYQSGAFRIETTVGIGFLYSIGPPAEARSATAPRAPK